MKRQITILLTIFFAYSLSAQPTDKKDWVPEFENAILKYFQHRNWDHNSITRDSLYLRKYPGGNFNLSISNDPVFYDTAHVIIKNPYYSEKSGKSQEPQDYSKNYPKSYTVIYQNLLISLFESGHFSCLTLNNFVRDLEFENKINTKKFKYHWVYNNRLFGFSGHNLYQWGGKSWIKSKDPFPLKDQPKLFDDNEFVIYGDCHGEWGGTVYFFEKATGKTFFTESTCPATVTKSKEGYEVLSNLGHMSGSCEIKNIADPRLLSLANPADINKTIKGQALGYTDKSNACTIKLDLYGVQLFSSFNYKNRKLYIVNLDELTFIAEINHNNIEIVHPLFFNDLYTHNPITTNYGDYTLVNLTLYTTGLKREISVLLISNSGITKIDWNEDHSR